jgi:hypothetical protein
MDCLEAQAMLSVAHDGEPVDPKDLAAAREHCGECDGCSRFAAGLRYLDVMPVPVPPPGVLDAIFAAVALAAQEREEADRVELDAPEAAEAEPATAPVPEPAEPRRSSWLSDRTKWTAIGAVGAVAATVLIVFASIGGPTGSAPSEQSASTGRAVTQPATPGAAVTDSGHGSIAGAPAAAPNPVPAAAPDYVVYGDLVYLRGGALADSSDATPAIGSVTTAFAGAGAPRQAVVCRSPLSDGSIVIGEPDGYRLYSPVVRPLSGKRYQLVSGDPLDRFGVWPTLPARFTPPVSSDGSPVFTAAGADGLGVLVYAAVGQPVDQGFAVAPAAGPTDPAAGNPNWTWWRPIAP